jgi:hypothetical protein
MIPAVMWPIVAIALTIAAAQQPASRDTTALPGAARGVIRGRVTAAATGQPLHRVRVTLSTQNPNPPTAVTDTRGLFEITGVPPGAYSLSAARAGYLTVQYGQRRPREPGRTIQVTGGDAIEGIDLALVKGGVLSGRITDETGDPLPGARVEAIELRYVRGQRVPLAARVTFTNDAGEYRLSGLESGSYQLRASSTEVWESDDGKNTYVHAVTYFPGVTSGDRPESIALTAGQEVASLEIRLIAGAAARVTGVVQDASGAPLAGQQVNLDRITRGTGGVLQSAGFGGSTKTDSRGMFEIPKLAAGEYMAHTGGPSERVSAAVILAEGASRHVALVPSRPVAVTGVIVTDDGSPPPGPAARLAIDPIAADPALVLPSWGAPRAQPPSPDWKFRFSGLEGGYLFRMSGLPDGWMLKSVMLGDRELIDQPLTIARGQADVDGLRLVVTRKGGKVSGEVVDAAGAPAPDTTVVVFAENSALWGVASRFIRAVRPDAEGRFAAGNLPPGIYRAVAKDVVIDGQWEDPAFLQALVRDATRVEIAEGAAATVKLTAGAIR